MKTPLPPLIPLLTIAQTLNETKLPWAVGASMMLAFRGLPVEVHDIDLITTPEAFGQVSNLLQTMGRRNPSRPGGKYHTECFTEFTIEGTDVDLMAGFAVEKDGIIHRFPLRAEDPPEQIEMMGCTIPLQSLATWRGCYEAMGRKDKVELIDDWTRQQERWLDWAVELQALAQAGLQYGKDVFDRERYTRIREIAAEMIGHQAMLPLPKVRELFCCETGYQTPKLDSRAAIVREDKLLLVQESNGKWALPGGWVDAGLTTAENTVKEAREEAGLEVEVQRLIAVLDWEKNNQPLPRHAWKICKVFYLCKALGGSFRPNSETLASRYFGPDELPELATEKTTVAQVAMCLAAAKDPHWQTVFDRP